MILMPLSICLPVSRRDEMIDIENQTYNKDEEYNLLNLTCQYLKSSTLFNAIIGQNYSRLCNFNIY